MEHLPHRNLIVRDTIFIGIFPRNNAPRVPGSNPGRAGSANTNNFYFCLHPPSDLYVYICI